jgi:hypothetical protein
VVQQHVKIKVELVTPERTPTGAIEIEPGVIEHGATLIPFEPPLDRLNFDEPDPVLDEGASFGDVVDRDLQRADHGRMDAGAFAPGINLRGAGIATPRPVLAPETTEALHLSLNRIAEAKDVSDIVRILATATP